MSWWKKIIGEPETEAESSWLNPTDAEADAASGGRIPLSLQWRPRLDITAHELARLTPYVARGSAGLGPPRDTMLCGVELCGVELWDALGPSLQRHFMVVADRKRP